MSLNPSIYRIDTESRKLKNCKSHQDKISKIVKSTFKDIDDQVKFNLQSLNHFSDNGKDFYLHTDNTNEVKSKWQAYFPGELTSKLNFSEQRLSLLLFISTPWDLYCVIGGNGNSYRWIVPFIDDYFGIETYCKIMNLEEDNLSSIKSRLITGNLAGMTGQYRDNYKVIDYAKFGKIPQIINILLSQKTSDLHFSFLQDKNERIEIVVSKSWKFKKSIEFSQLDSLIDEFGIIKSIDTDQELSSYKVISDDFFIRENLYPLLIDNLFDSVLNLGRDKTLYQPFQFDFCNPNSIEKFYEADTYVLKELNENKKHVEFNRVEDRRYIFNYVLSRAAQLKLADSRFDFMVYIQGVRVSAYKGETMISNTFLNHFSTEIEFDSKPYFLLDTKWYLLKDSFVKDLELSTINTLNNNSANFDLLPLKWDKAVDKEESDYNDRYDLLDNYIVIDTVLNDNIELCDIIHFDSKNLYLIHIKYGFNSKVRELTNQIEIAARRLKEALGGGNYKYLEDIYDSLISKNRSVCNLSKKAFVKLFKSKKKISFVFAYTSHLKEDYELVSNLHRFKSNIARFSFVSCTNLMKNDYYELLNFQIRKN